MKWVTGSNNLFPVCYNIFPIQGEMDVFRGYKKSV